MAEKDKVSRHRTSDYSITQNGDHTAKLDDRLTGIIKNPNPDDYDTQMEEARAVMKGGKRG